ncbi:hypothetical protein [Maridesulfovibrio salexigens]|uniref:Uncharacterized protein n=1 Tax=Maridesulfovibrio salexigens (strain ATCC 14822 / DSM 2638 / NCIMB 8403 / VKM B-1763) TaxID=526222 RepID=C6BWK4_MARSD|nr:hypothetical protein [Maridesulfovibrio salexigens]ACS80284.1 hypothetical protein Desal_2228 [Maridesulfovibrio salexigens DSM 2638]
MKRICCIILLMVFIATSLTGCVLLKRKKYVNNLAGGEALYDVNEAMGSHFRDRSSYDNGVRFRKYVIDETGTYKYAVLCFYRNVLVGKSRAVCEYAADEQNLVNETMAEMELFERMIPMLGLSVSKIKPLDYKGKFSLRGIVIGAPLPKKVQPCPGQSITTVPQIDVGRTCVTKFYTDSAKLEVHNLPPIGIDGNMVLDMENGKVDNLYFFVEKYAEPGLGDKLLDLIVGKFGKPQRFTKNRVADDKGRYHIKKVGIWNIRGDLLYVSTYAEHAKRPILIAVNDYFIDRAKSKKKESGYTDNL